MEAVEWLPFKIEDPKIFIAVVVGFAIIVLVVLRLPVPYLSVPHYRKVLDEREGRIATNKQQVDTAIADVQKLRSDYAARLERIEEEARERMAVAVREADAAQAEIIAEAEQLAQAIRRRADEELARERTRQRILFRQQLVRTALDSAESAVRKVTDEPVQRKLIGDFIAQAVTSAPGRRLDQGGA